MAITILPVLRSVELVTSKSILSILYQFRPFSQHFYHFLILLSLVYSNFIINFACEVIKQMDKPENKLETTEKEAEGRGLLLHSTSNFLEIFKFTGTPVLDLPLSETIIFRNGCITCYK